MNDSVMIVMTDARAKTCHATSVRDDGVTKKGSARCADGDEFVPEIGAIIALCRAMGAKPEMACAKVIDAYVKKAQKELNVAKQAEAKAKAGPEKGTPVGMVKIGRCVLKPFTRPFDVVRSYGVMGTPTLFKDKNNKPLFVGDLVEVETLVGTVRKGRKWEKANRLCIVVDEDSDSETSKGQYVMGILSSCNPKTGKIGGGARVRKVKSWKEVEIGETHGLARVEWEAEA